MKYEERTYRNLHKQDDLEHFRLVVEETDLDIAVTKGVLTSELYEKARSYVQDRREELKEYIKRDPVFAKTLQPHNPLEDAPELVAKMCIRALQAGVGPMAAVAGALAEVVGLFLLDYSGDVIVENGGDIWLKSDKDRKIGIFAGDSPFSCRIGMEIKNAQTPLGICTSSGTVGHSLSFGRADAVVVLSPSAVLADAVATSACNRIKTQHDLEGAVDFALAVPGIIGVVAIMGDKLAARGEVELYPV